MFSCCHRAVGWSKRHSCRVTTYGSCYEKIGSERLNEIVSFEGNRREQCSSMPTGPSWSNSSKEAKESRCLLCCAVTGLRAFRGAPFEAHPIHETTIQNIHVPLGFRHRSGIHTTLHTTSTVLDGAAHRSACRTLVSPDTNGRPRWHSDDGRLLALRPSCWPRG